VGGGHYEFAGLHFATGFIWLYVLAPSTQMTAD